MQPSHLSELRKQYDRSSGRIHFLVRSLFWLGGVYALWVLFGFFGLPPILRSQMQNRLTAELHRAVTVEKIAFNPLLFSVTIEGLKIAEPAPDTGTFLGWRRLYVNFDTFSFVRREWRFQNIELDGFEGQVAVDAKKHLNFADLLEKLGQQAKSTETAKKPWPLVVVRLAVAQARLVYSDESQSSPFKTEIGPTTVTLRDFHTGGKGHAPGEFSATTESGETFKWSGRVAFAPLRSEGRVELGNFSLKKYAPYYASRVRFDLLDGKLGIAGRYVFSFENGQPALRLSEGKIGVRALKLAPRGGTEPVVALNLIEITEAAATWPQVSARAKALVVTGGSVSVCRTAQGIDLAELLLPVAAETATQPPVSLSPGPAVSATAPAPLNVKVSEVTVRGLAVRIEDRTTPRVAKHQLGELSTDLRDVSLTELAKPIQFGLRANYGTEGHVRTVGWFTLSPIKAQLGLELTQISLANLSPYAETFADVRVGRGTMTALLQLEAELPPDKAPVLSAEGEVTVENFAAHDAAEIDELASWRTLSIKGLQYSNQPAKMQATEIYWLEPSGHFIVNADGTTNLQKALRLEKTASVTSEETPPSVQFPAAKTAEAPVRTAGPLGDMMASLDRFVLDKASMDFTDRSLTPNVRMVLNQFSGQIEGLSTSEISRASVDIRGRIDGITPVIITGKTNPLSIDASTEMKISVKSMELAPVGPYAGKFAGYELERGSLSVDVKFGIKKRKVDAANVATIDQFTFGNATNSPDATKLPVRLAVALLRDTSGKIVLDVPVQGSLDDPEFRVGRVVWRVIGNILAKAATSPFSLLGAMFGGGKGEELSYQSFMPGEDIPVSDEEIAKLDIVAKALKERPALRLDIIGGYDEVADAAPLRELALENQMRNIIWNDRRMMDSSITLEQVQIDPVQKNGMIRRLFYRAFPKEKPKRSSPGDPEYSDEGVSGQKGNLGAFTRKKKVVAPAPAPMQRQEVASGNRKNADGTTDTSSEVKEVRTFGFDEMKARLLAQITVDEEAFRKLAADRANAVRLYLINHGEIPAERLSLVPITGEQPAAKGARVELKLK